jgi:predicted alpha/beta superfamily hydrolase
MYKRLFLLFSMGCLTCLWSFAGFPLRQEIRKENASYPQVEIKDTEMRTLQSKFVGQEYKIDIFFPKDYKKEDKRYPAVYVLDAEYNFGCVAYIARRLIKNGDIPEILLVGIAYDTDYEDFYAKRFRDSTPESRIHGRNSGGVEKFSQFVEQELIPFVDQNYRTIPGDRTIVGHSITGFYCCYALFRHPDLFNRYISISPSLWFSNDVIFEYEEAFASNRKDMKSAVYLSVGEEESQRMRDGSLRLHDTLLTRRYPHLKFHFSLVEGENHRSLFPFAFSRGLRFVFSENNP